MKQFVKLLISVLILQSCINSNSEKLNWNIHNESDNMIYPSAVIALANINAEYSSDKKPNEIGDNKSWFSVYIKSPKENSSITISLYETSFWYKTTSNYIMPHKDIYYEVQPKINWKYNNLRNQNQPTPIDVTLKVQVDGKDLGTKTQTFSMRSINECIYALYEDNEWLDLSFLFAAYVNEDHPVVQQILKEGLESGLINNYIGYQGTIDDVYYQVAAIWNALQHRGIKYINYTETSQTSDIIRSQRVRTISEALKYTQANCVDGSVLIASVLRAIGIDPILIKVPGHMFLGFYINQDHTTYELLETTLLGVNDYTYSDLYPELSYLDSYYSFISAIESAHKTYNKYKNSNQMIMIDIETARKFIKPIGL